MSKWVDLANEVLGEYVKTDLTNDDIFDYNIDSLDIIRIQTKLLEYNIKLNTQDFYKYRTIKLIK